MSEKQNLIGTMKNFFITILAAVGIAVAATAAQVQQNVSGARSQNILLLSTNLNDAETLTIGANVFEIDLNNSNRVTAGRIRIDLTALGTHATNKLLFTNQPIDGDTITIQGKGYTFRTVINDATNGDIFIGANLSLTISSLAAALTMDAEGASSDYSSGTTRSSNVVYLANTATNLTISAVDPGKEPNAFTCTSSSTNYGWLNTTLKGGAGPHPTDAHVATNIVNTINRSNSVAVIAQIIATNQIAILSKTAGRFTTACSETMAGASLASTTLAGGKTGDPIVPNTIVSRVPSAAEETLGQMQFFFPYTPVDVVVQVRSTNGVPLTWNGAVAINGQRVTIDNSGSVDWGALTNRITVEVSP